MEDAMLPRPLWTILGPIIGPILAALLCAIAGPIAVPIAALAVLVADPPHAGAQTATAQAQNLFDEGRRLLASGKVAEACLAFEASEKLDPAVTTQLNLASCREQNNQLASAWAAFVEAERMAHAAGSGKLEKVANGHARKLQPRLSRLTVAVPPDRRIPGLEVLRGSDPVDAARWNQAVPIDGGSYTITARAPGREPWSTITTVKTEGDVQTVAVPQLTESRAAAAPVRPAPAPIEPRRAPPVAGGSSPPGAKAPSGVASVPPPPSAPAPEPPDAARRGPWRALMLAAGGGAIAFGGAAVGFKLWGDSIYDDAKNHKVGMTQGQLDSSRHRANVRLYTAQVLGVVAIASAGAAVYFYVRGRGEERAMALAPVVSPEGAGVALTGRW
jgi:hypothetical protein